MQLTVDKETLVKAVHHTLGVVDRRGTMPILSHALLQVEKGGITISATDLELSYRGFCPAEVEEPGALALPAHYFHNLVKDLPGTKVDLHANGNCKLKVRAGESLYQFSGLPADQFPEISAVSEDSLVEVEAGVLKEMIEKTIFCVPDGDYRSGVYLEMMEKGLRMVSTDGHRLSLIDRPLFQGGQFSLDEGIQVPKKGATEICRALEGEKTVGLFLSEKELALKSDGKLLMVRLLARKFPDYRRIIPEGFEFGFTLDRKAFLEMLRRVTLLSKDRFRGVALKMGPESMEASFVNPEVGEGHESLPLALAWGDDGLLPLEVGFNARYLLEPLDAMRCEKVLLEVNDRDRPCRLRGEGDPDYFGLVMPMTIC